MRESDLEVLPLGVLVLVTVSDDDGGAVSSGQTLVVLHQLVGLVDAEQLQTDTQREFTRNRAATRN